MRKQVQGRKFSQKRDQRKAFFKALLTALFECEKMKTTEARAKEISRLSEKIITRAKKGDLACRRLLAKYLHKGCVKKLIEEIAPKYKKREGGYTRIIKLGQRKHDGAKMAIIELVK